MQPYYLKAFPNFDISSTLVDVPHSPSSRQKENQFVRLEVYLTFTNRSIKLFSKQIEIVFVVMTHTWHFVENSIGGDHCVGFSIFYSRKNALLQISYPARTMPSVAFLTQNSIAKTTIFQIENWRKYSHFRDIKKSLS